MNNNFQRFFPLHDQMTLFICVTHYDMNKDFQSLFPWPVDIIYLCKWHTMFRFSLSLNRESQWF